MGSKTTCRTEELSFQTIVAPPPPAAEAAPATPPALPAVVTDVAVLPVAEDAAAVRPDAMPAEEAAEGAAELPLPAACASWELKNPPEPDEDPPK